MTEKKEVNQRDPYPRWVMVYDVNIAFIALVTRLLQKEYGLTPIMGKQLAMLQAKMTYWRLDSQLEAYKTGSACGWSIASRDELKYALSDIEKAIGRCNLHLDPITIWVLFRGYYKIEPSNCGSHDPEEYDNADDGIVNLIQALRDLSGSEEPDDPSYKGKRLKDPQNDPKVNRCLTEFGNEGRYPWDDK